VARQWPGEAVLIPNRGNVMTSTDDRIYILIAGEDFELAVQTGSYRAASLSVEGFIHASPRSQLARVANKYYSTVSDLRLMLIDPARVAPKFAGSRRPGACIRTSTAR
jgi:uncharacterized protein (DUF952 family)